MTTAGRTHPLQRREVRGQRTGSPVEPSDVWPLEHRGEIGADRILDAARSLFSTHPPESVGMHEIAKAAGCSRATVYRYFENRETLRAVYMNRESSRLYHQVVEQITGLDDPRERLIAGVTTALRLVRQSPALASWFTRTGIPIGGAIAEQSDVIQALTAAFLFTLGPDEPSTVTRRARWLVRVMTSLLIFTGCDDADELAMLEEFVVPIIAPVQADQ
ncbi:MULTISPECIES: TetR/AcrR family transcriptional regulator [Mycolicibacter]|uniref:TetR/AcrR family transcriptional regulator n=1 Tax=Mycolicibacter kumamotonensis TaxID=354243 RepID=A0A7K3LCJ5_9MYCO|nr:MULTISPECIES: TetR/AcrR family transcriptional regulator [Mycolicibacter]NDJ90085.1 TetR/AcrR family transcriptional regulator [Mycolicibacter kumamotonensis]RAV01819.1 TetR/AcrR family transcriptional regulator [Mycolicibacter senuensis]